MIIIYPERTKGVELKSYNLVKRLIGTKVPEECIAGSVESHFKYTAGHASRSDKLEYFEKEKERNRIYDWVLYINDEIVLSYPDEEKGNLIVEEIIKAFTENKNVFILKGEEENGV